MQGNTYFSFLAPKHRLLVLVRTAVQTYSHNQCFEQKLEEKTNVKRFLLKFSTEKKLYIERVSFRYEFIYAGIRKPSGHL